MSFNPIPIRDVVLADDCVKLLRTQDAQLEAAGAIKSLFAWSPLMLITGEANAGHVAFSIQSTDWDQLVKSIIAVDKVLFSTLATACLVHSASHEGNASLKQFWRTMSDFYGDAIPQDKPPDVIGTWTGNASKGNRSLQIVATFSNAGNGITGTVSVPQRGQSDTMANLRIGLDGSISFNGANTGVSVTGRIGSPRSMSGTFSGRFGSGNWSVAR